MAVALYPSVWVRLHRVTAMFNDFYFTLFLFGKTPTWCVQVLRSPKEAFAAAIQSWRERCEKCVCLPGDYDEK